MRRRAHSAGGQRSRTVAGVRLVSDGPGAWMTPDGVYAFIRDEGVGRYWLRRRDGHLETWLVEVGEREAMLCSSLTMGVQHLQRTGRI